MNDKEKDTVDVGKLLSLVRRKKLFLLKVWGITLVAALIIIIPQPRGYTAEAVLVPERSDGEAVGGLSSLASSFGFNIGSAADAIYPQIYPDVVGSNDFIISLFDIPVQNIDGDLSCDLYTYMAEHQKIAFYAYPFRACLRFLRRTFGAKEPDISAYSKDSTLVNGVNPFFLSRRQKGIIALIGDAVECRVDKKTEMITLRYSAQDPLVAATVTDSVVARLQRFIIDYRTTKARQDLDYYTRLMLSAKDDYEKARHTYASFADAYTDITLPSYQVRLEDYENEMQLRYNTYTTITTQRDMALAKVQERTPAFTIIQGASVPLRASSPKRMMFCLVMLLLATAGAIAYLVAKEK